MSGKLTENQQDKMVTTMCRVALLIGFGIAALPIALIVKEFIH